MDDLARANIRRILDEVSDLQAKALIANAVQLSLGALEGLAKIDETIHSHLAFYKDDPSRAVAMILEEADSLGLRKVRTLIAFLMSRGLIVIEQPEAEPDVDSMDDFGFGDFDMSAFDEAPADTGRESSPFKVEELDIEEAFDSIAPGDEEREPKKLEEMRKEFGVLGHALREQLTTCEERLGEAQGTGNHEVVMRELDVARESLTEGLFELVTMIFELFTGSCERSNLLPGYKDALEKSLLIRRGVGDLTRAVNEANSIIQDEEMIEALREEMFRVLLVSLESFMQSEAFHVMRAPDRWELAGLNDDIANSSFDQAQLASEGLSKYLESLSVINQREVLQQHDAEVISNVHQYLDAGRSLLLVSVAGAQSQIAEALQNAVRLQGRSIALDSQLQAWADTPPALDTREGLDEVIGKLEQLV